MTGGSNIGVPAGEALEWIVARCDDVPLRAATRAINRDLVRSMPDLAPHEAEIVAAFDRGDAIDIESEAARLVWEHCKWGTPASIGRARILWGLVAKACDIGGFEAELTIDFARDAGVPNEAIAAAFAGLAPNQDS